jgi:hypothetical protein
MTSTSPTAIKRTLSTAFNGVVTEECIRIKRSRIVTLSPSESEPQQKRCPTAYQITDKISIIRTMQLQESTTYRPSHYLDHTEVTAEDRKKLCQWGFHILDASKLDRHIVVIAIGYFDRFMSSRGLRVVEACLRNQREFQLAFVVSSFDLRFTQCVE